MAEGIPIPQGATIGEAQAQDTTSTASVPIPQGASIGTEQSNAGQSGDSGILGHVKNVAQHVMDTMPVVSQIHNSAEAVQNWADKKMSPENPHMQSPAATFGEGVLRDTAGMISGATSLPGLATTGATIVAPEVMGPALVGHGIHSMIQGWGDLTNPDVLQRELMAAAEVSGGAAATGEAIKTGGGPITQQVRQNIAQKALNKAPDQQLSDFKTAIPPTKSAPYTDVDVHAARPYIESQNIPIDSPVGLRDAADSAIAQIEGRVDGVVQQHPTETITTNPLYDVYSTLKQNTTRLDFLEAGMNELEKYPLGFQRAGGQVDPPLTLQSADDLRWQLNQDNKAVVARNNYDLALAKATDPGFAAREAAAESLRNGIYDKLEQLGFKEARALRRDEGSIIKIRNASLKQEFNGERNVRTPNAPSRGRQAAANVAKKASIGAGTYLGAKLGGTGGAVAGAEAGSALGDVAANAIAPKNMTRNSLLQRSFRPTPTINPAQITNEGAGSATLSGSAENDSNDRIVFRSSDGSIHSIPKNEHALAHARFIDPKLEIIESAQ